DANGLLTQTAEQVSFRSTGSGATPSTNFQQVGSSIKTFGDITVKYRPTGNPNTWFPKASDNNSLYIALQVKNTKAATNQQFVASQYHLAKEEIIEADEVTIEKAVKASTTSKYELVSGYATSAFNTGTGQFTEAANNTPNTSLTNTAAAAKTDAHFVLNVYKNAERQIPGVTVPDNNTGYEGSIVLEEKLRGFYARTQVGNKIVSMDDYGLEGYDLRFGFATNTAHPQQQNWLKLDEATGEISVKESTSGFYNTAAIGNYAIVKVDLYPNATSTQIIATRYIKIGFVQNQVSDVNINGTASLTLTNAATQDATLYFTAPNTILDQAYNITGGSAAQFHGLYNWSFTSAETSGGAPVSTSWFTFLNMNNPNQNVERIVQ